MESLIKKPLSDLLKDFGAGSTPPAKTVNDTSCAPGEECGESAPPVEPLIPYTREEIEEIRRTAFADGQKEGREAAIAEATANLSASVDCFVEALNEAAVRSRRNLEEASKSFMSVLAGSLSCLIEDQGLCAKLQRSLSSDIQDIVSDCPDAVMVYLSPEDLVQVRKEVPDNEKLQLKEDDSLTRGQVRLISDENEICVDHNAWAKQVQGKIIDAVKAYSLSSSH